MAEFLLTLKSDFIKCFITKNRWKFITTGLKNTLIITFLALIIGVVLGIFIAIVRSSYDKTYSEMKKGLKKGLLGFCIPQEDF